MEENPLHQNGVPLLYRRIVNNVWEFIYLNTCVTLFSKTSERKKIYSSEYSLSNPGKVRINTCMSSCKINVIVVWF